jgi:hypothetical protein
MHSRRRASRSRLDECKPKRATVRRSTSCPVSCRSRCARDTVLVVTDTDGLPGHAAQATRGFVILRHLSPRPRPNPHVHAVRAGAHGPSRGTADLESLSSSMSTRIPRQTNVGADGGSVSTRNGAHPGGTTIVSGSNNSPTGYTLLNTSHPTADSRTSLPSHINCPSEAGC